MIKPMATRLEKDSLGELEIPSNVYYGIQTQRAVDNFPISGWRSFNEFILATAHIKKAAAIANRELGLLEDHKADAILQAAEEMIGGRFREEVVVDVFQAGAGTSYHMNVNEILANRAIEILGGRRGDYAIVSPNDDVNFGQSTNDVIPTSMRIAVLLASKPFLTALEALSAAFHRKAKEFDHILKCGRTHLQDAVPMRLGQEFGSYAAILDQHRERVERVLEEMHALGIGGTAIGTGLNAHPSARFRIIELLKTQLGFPFAPAKNLFAAMQSMAPFVAVSSALRNLGLDLVKICGDLRFLTSGPKAGIRELLLPALQPGSSIMPGKVNPGMPEMMTMVAYQVAGNDHAIALSSQAGQLELNVMMPLITFNLSASFWIMTNALRTFAAKCVEGITANADRCQHFAERTAALATTLNTHVGYLEAASIAKEALSAHKSIRQIVLERGLMTEEELKKALDLDAMTRASETNAK
jgi:aspartate ammonia-lyase